MNLDEMNTSETHVAPKQGDEGSLSFNDTCTCVTSPYTQRQRDTHKSLI